MTEFDDGFLLKVLMGLAAAGYAFLAYAGWKRDSAVKDFARSRGWRYAYWDRAARRELGALPSFGSWFAFWRDIWNVVRGEAEGVELRLFDLKVSLLDGEDGETRVTRTVAAFRLGADLPRFSTAKRIFSGPELPLVLKPVLAPERIRGWVVEGAGPWVAFYRQGATDTEDGARLGAFLDEAGVLFRALRPDLERSAGSWTP